MRMPRHGRFRALPVRSLAPNILTVLAICAGLTAIRFALQERWELAVAAVIVAAIFDGLDGRLARLLKGATKFGAELDSLSDFVCFGVAPAVVLYIWSLQEIGGMGWILVLGFAVSMGLRLARFNTALEDPDRPAFLANFFTGVPAPAAAGLALVPMMLSFQGAEGVFRLPMVVGPYLVIVALLTISRLPTYSFKKLRIARDNVLTVLMLVGVGAAFVVSYPWFTFTVMAAVYVGSFPLSYRTCARLMAEHAAAAEGAANPAHRTEEDPSA